MSKALPRFSNSEVREEAGYLRRLGFEFQGQGRGHYRFRHPDYGLVLMSVSPSDHRWQHNHRSSVAMKMGLTRTQLEQRLGIRRPKSKRKRTKSGKGKNRRRPVHRPKSRRVRPSPCDKLFDLRAELRDLTPKVDAAARLNHVDAERLEKQHRDLRREILETEALCLEE